MPNNKPKLLDLFCKAGGAGFGYNLAGFCVVGVDIEFQKNYPFEFHQSDALEYLKEHWTEFDIIHASPPCQRFSSMTNGRWKDRLDEHPDLIEPIRNLLIKTGKPYIIENVVGAPLINPTMLCGSMFNLKVRKHRLFETSFRVEQLECSHKLQGKVVGVYGHAGGKSNRDGIQFSSTQSWRDAMGIQWMSGNELSQAIPPAYTEYIGKEFLNGQSYSSENIEQLLTGKERISV